MKTNREMIAAKAYRTAVATYGPDLEGAMEDLTSLLVNEAFAPATQDALWQVVRAYLKRDLTKRETMAVCLALQVAA